MIRTAEERAERRKARDLEEQQIIISQQNATNPIIALSEAASSKPNLPLDLLCAHLQEREIKVVKIPILPEQVPRMWHDYLDDFPVAQIHYQGKEDGLLVVGALYDAEEPIVSKLIKEGFLKARTRCFYFNINHFPCKLHPIKEDALKQAREQLTRGWRDGDDIRFQLEHLGGIIGTFGEEGMRAYLEAKGSGYSFEESMQEAGRAAFPSGRKHIWEMPAVV